MKQFSSKPLRETLPEKVSKTIKEAILAGELRAGELLPTEPELEGQFGVSRAVVRDAMRMLKAQGLIDVRHGKGMYVSISQHEAFADALLTSLRRDNASAWDVEQFEQILLPEVIILAASAASQEDTETIDKAADRYMQLFYHGRQQDEQELAAAYEHFMHTVFAASHNNMIILLGNVLVRMRKWRTVTDTPGTVENIAEMEKRFIMGIAKAIRSRNPQKAGEFRDMYRISSARLESILRSTPVGQSPVIPGEVFLEAYKPD